MGYFCENSNYFRDMVMQSFLNLGDFGDICQFHFRDMGYFSKCLKGYGIPGNPLPGHQHLIY